MLDDATVLYERHRPEQTALNRLVQQNAASLIVHTEAGAGSERPQFVRDEFDTLLDLSS